MSIYYYSIFAVVALFLAMYVFSYFYSLKQRERYKLQNRNLSHSIVYDHRDNGKVIYSSTAKPPHCNVHSGIQDPEFGALINIITPKYWILVSKIIIQLVLAAFMIQQIMNPSSEGLHIDNSNPASYLLLIPVIILMVWAFNNIKRFTQRVYLYTGGFEVGGIGSQRHGYDEIGSIHKGSDTKQVRYHSKQGGYYNTYTYNLAFYLISLHNHKPVKLRRIDYHYLNSKLEDLKTNLVTL